jgi:hypothetical protein
VAVKLQLPPTATVLMVKREVESELGIRPRDACVVSIDEAQTEKLDEETLDSLLVGEEAKLELSLLVEHNRQMRSKWCRSCLRSRAWF